MISNKSKKTWKIFSFVFIFCVGIFLIYFIYQNFLANEEIKKELLASITIAPNDTADTFINYDNNVKFKIPKGEVEQIDTLDIFNVTNIVKPEFANSLIKTYDFKFRKKNKFNDDVEIEISLSDELKSNSGNSIHLLYYNEEKNTWEDVEAEYDAQEKKIYFSTKHFSCFGIVEGDCFSNPSPKMQLHTRKSATLLKSAPDINKAESILKDYSESAGKIDLAQVCGLAMFEESFSITSAIGTLAEEILELPFVDKFNNIATELGLTFALKQFAFELYEGKDEQAKLNLSKNLMLYSLGKYGSQALKIANVGIFFIDYSLTKFGTKGLEVREKKYQDIYDNFNQHHNVYKKDVKEWTKFIVDVVSSSYDLKLLVDAEINNYLKACFNEEGSIIPDDVREILVSKEREKILIILHEALKVANEEMEEKRKNEIINKFAEMKKILNNEFQVRVMVYGEKEGSDEVIDLPVRIVVPKDQELWQGRTNNAGQWWFNCTWLGYIYYKKPTIVELEYEGKTLRQNFTPQEYGVDVRFYLPKKKTIDEETDTEFPSNLSGEYKGEISIKSKKKKEGSEVKSIVKYDENIIMDLEQLKNFEIPIEYKKEVILGHTVESWVGSYSNNIGFAKINVDNSGKANLKIINSVQGGVIMNTNEKELFQKWVEITEITGVANFKMNNSNKYISTIKAKLSSKGWSYLRATEYPDVKERNPREEYEIDVKLEIIGDKIIGEFKDPRTRGKKELVWLFEMKK